MSNEFDNLMKDVRQCVLCREHLPLGPRPILQVDTRAKILIASQAPGSRVHASGIPFDDPSGDRLRSWMSIDRSTFYDPLQIAIVPMGFCYPGKGPSGDLPPRGECAQAWRRTILGHLGSVSLTLLIGRYAQAWHLDEPKTNVTEIVRAWRSRDDSTIALPHPSPRNNIWLKRNPWFESELLPWLAEKVRLALTSNG